MGDAPSRRETLYVGPSTVVAGERGLFCSEPLAIGAFLGFYDGAWADAIRACPAFAMDVGRAACLDGDRDGLPCANEARTADEQNAAYASYYLFAQRDEEPVAEAIGMWAVRPIPAHAEVLVHYGPTYAEERERKGYTVGTPVEVDVAESPLDVLPLLPLRVFAPL